MNSMLSSLEVEEKCKVWEMKSQWNWSMKCKEREVSLEKRKPLTT